MQYPYPYFPPPPSASKGINITVSLLSICFLISVGLAYFLYQSIENNKTQEGKIPTTQTATSATGATSATSATGATGATSATVSTATNASIPPQNTFNNKQIKLTIDNKCLEGNGDKLLLNDCDVANTNTKQQWTFDGNLRHNWSEKCIDSIDDMLRFVVCSDTSPSQKWNYDRTKWISNSGRCLTGYFNSTTNQNVYSEPCNDSNYKKWAV